MHINCFCLLNPLAHDFRALYPLKRYNSWISLLQVVGFLLKTCWTYLFACASLKAFWNFLSVFRLWFFADTTNAINLTVFLHHNRFCKRWSAKCARKSERTERGKKLNLLRLSFHSRYGRWLYRKLKKTANKLNIFSRTSQPRSRYFPFVWHVVSINSFDQKRASWSRKEGYESISST